MSCVEHEQVAPFELSIGGRKYECAARAAVEMEPVPHSAGTGDVLPPDGGHVVFAHPGTKVGEDLRDGVFVYLSSCPQASVAGYPDVFRRELGLSDDRLIVAGMAVGRPDPAARVNSFVPERLPLAEFVQWRE